MNERIKELREQAADFVEVAWAKQTQATWETNKDIHTFYDEKFAELIVRECMTQIQQVREIKAGHAGPEYTQGFDDGMFVAISTIEEHFGVEE
jgi:hypothetical protein